MVDNDLVHYSKEPLRKIRSAEQDNGFPHKPRGLWFSVEDGFGWKEWCEAEEFAQDCFVHAHRIKIADKAKILHLKSADEIRTFTKNYEGKSEVFSKLPSFFIEIDWRRVAEEYQGIVIAPYQWDCRLDMSCTWYYAWDCSSGCIWDAAAISEVEMIDN